MQEGSLNQNWSQESRLVGIRFKKSNYWIPICDSVLIIQYLNAGGHAGARAYRNIYAAWHQDFTAAGVAFGIGGAAFMFHAIVMFSPMASFLVPVYATGFGVAALLTLHGVSKYGSEKGNLRTMVASYNGAVSKRM